MLLERLRWPPPGGSVPRRPDPEDPTVIRESIRRNLERLLNSHKDMAQACPDYGLPDMVELISQLPDGRQKIMKQIEHSIVKFEPRLADVRVSYVMNPSRTLCACFHISARVRDSRDPVRFETEVGLGHSGPADGQVRVESR